jgi:iron complex transport system permease protein
MDKGCRGIRLRSPAMGLMGLWVLLVGMFTLDVALGSVYIPPDNLLMILLGGEPENPSWRQIVLIFRLPRAVTAILAGAALSVSGLQVKPTPAAWG